MGKLDGKAAIVTGGGRGLGRAFAHRLAGLGARVAIADIDLKSYEAFPTERKLMSAENTVEEIRAAGGESVGFELDVGDRDAVFAMAEAVHKAWGRIDILVANAGGGRGDVRSQTPTTTPPGIVEEIFRLNYHGMVNCCSAVAPYMKVQRSGKIVTLSSRAGIAHSDPHNTGFVHYGAAKAAVAHYTRYLAQELGPYGVYANSIAPGSTATGLVVDKVAATGPLPPVALGRLGLPEECARVVEFLVSDQSDYITGLVLPFDGGAY